MEKLNLESGSILDKIDFHGLLNPGSSKNLVHEYFKKVIFEAYKICDYKLVINSPAPIEKLASLFGTRMSFSSKLISEGRLSKQNGMWNIEIPLTQVSVYNKAEYLTEKGRFSLAHELAHFILQYMENRFPKILVELDVREKQESLCDFIASEFLLPSHLFNKPYFSKDLLVSNPFSQNEVKIVGIQTIEKMRKALNVSRTTLIRKLDKTFFLDTTECGIIISLFGINKKTGRSPALRILYAALPSWGFLPTNIKITTIGIKSAVEVFNSLGYKVIHSWKGQIRVTEKSTADHNGKWVHRDIASYGENAIFPLTEKNNYLVTTFRWEKP